jgi:aquaporin Z
MTAAQALRAHWPEYLIEGWALGMFMLSAALFATLLGAPQSPLTALLPDATLRGALVGIAMGATAIALIYSPWGQRSGAHMNPSVTLAFLHLGKITRWDAAFYIVAQFVGGLLGVLIGAALLGSAFTHPPVGYATTLPGPAGVPAAFVAEFAISALMMATVLTFAGHARLSRYTGIAAGILVAAYIAFEAPLSGMSMNPARSFASAAPAMRWEHFWIYMTAPVLGMLGAAWLIGRRRMQVTLPCAKLVHGEQVRCIHCGYEPARKQRAATHTSSYGASR